MSSALVVVAVVLVQTAAGLGVVAASGLARTGRDLLRHAAIAPLAGMAWSGVVAATLGTFGSRLSVGGLVLLAIGTCAAGAVRMRRAGGPGTPRAASLPRRSVFDWLVIGSSLLALGVILSAATALVRIKSLAEYDGWAMWGMKARAIAELGGADTRLFASPAYGRLHLEYPLLLPSLNALPLQLVDEFDSNIVVLGCFAIGLAGLAAVWGLLRERVRASLLLPFVAALATAPAFFGQLATGYADVPVAVFVAAGALSAACWLLEDERPLLVLTTLFVAAAALTKNEGLLFGAATYVALVVTAAGRRRAVAVSAAVVALAYAPWKAYVAIHDLGAPDYDLTSSFDVPWVARRLDRAPEAAHGLLDRATATHELGILLLVATAAALLALALGPRRLGAFTAVFGVLSFAGLTWIYVLTPNGVEEFLSSNGDRIVVSPVVGLTALAPLVVEETARSLTRQRLPDATRAPAGSSSRTEAQPVA